MKTSKKILSTILVFVLASITIFSTSFNALAASKPESTSISSISSKSTSISIKWTKKSGITGYQIQYATNKDFESAKTIKITKSSTTSKTIKDLKSKKRYYIRIRTYKTEDSKKHYSSWSKSKNITTKSSSKKSSNSSSSSGSIYITPTGKRYHRDSSCNGGTYIKSTLSEAKAKGLTPCQKCCN